LGRRRWIALALNFVALEELVLLAASAIGALKAAGDEHGHTHRNQDGEYVSIQSEPMQ
jgi:hypothetical protein